MTVEEIKQDIDRLFSDTKVPVSETRSRLRDIIEHIEMLIESLPEGDDE
jgi:hypothetical protein